MIKQWLGLILGKFVVSVAGNFELGSTSVLIFALYLCFYSRCLFFLDVASIIFFWSHRSRGNERIYPIDGNSDIQPGGVGEDDWVLMDCGLNPVGLGQRPNGAQTAVNTDTLSSETFPEPVDLFRPTGGMCNISAGSHDHQVQAAPPPYVHHFVQPFKNSAFKKFFTCFTKIHPYWFSFVLSSGLFYFFFNRLARGRRRHSTILHQ